MARTGQADECESLLDEASHIDERVSTQPAIKNAREGITRLRAQRDAGSK